MSTALTARLGQFVSALWERVNCRMGCGVHGGASAGGAWALAGCKYDGLPRPNQFGLLRH